MKNKVDKIISKLKWKIYSGTYKTFEKLPSEKALTIKYNCSRQTIRKALKALIDENLVFSQAAKGYFIAFGDKQRKYQTKSDKEIVSYHFEISKLDLTDEQKLVFKNLNNQVFEKVSHPFIFLKTHFDQSKRAFTVLHSFLNKDLFVNFQVKNLEKSLAKFLGKRDIKVEKRIERINIIKPSMMVAHKLKLNYDDYVVAVYSIMFDDHNNIIEYAIRYTLLDDYSDTFEKKY